MVLREENEMALILEECGCCGFYHRKGYEGDCRNDDERYNLEEIEFFSVTGDKEVNIRPATKEELKPFNEKLQLIKGKQT